MNTRLEDLIKQFPHAPLMPKETPIKHDFHGYGKHRKYHLRYRRMMLREEMLGYMQPRKWTFWERVKLLFAEKQETVDKDGSLEYRVVYKKLKSTDFIFVLREEERYGPEQEWKRVR